MRATFGITLALALCTAVGVRAASNAHTAFGGTVGVTNPCNGEGISGAGPVKIVYVDGGDHFVVHFTFKAAGVGAQGNSYLFSFAANGQFDEPTTVSGGLSTFVLPVHATVVTKGKAPNFDWDLGVRIFVVGGQATGAQLIGPATTTCHG
jgi:hypothetical protein